MNLIWAALAVVPLAFAAVYDMVRLATPTEKRCPPHARGRRAALEAAEVWCVGLRLHGQISTAAHQQGMSGLAHGDRVTPTGQDLNEDRHG